MPSLRTLYLRSVGRKSGKPRRTRLYYIEDGANLALVPSNGGRDRDPAWWLNLQATPEAEVEVGKTVRPIRAYKASPEDDARLWLQFVAGLALYAAYRRRTTREIPVVILEPREPTEEYVASRSVPLSRRTTNHRG